ncbi:hypothetical protein SEUCBS139899_005219 [Sporothrix eucalyptigena]|uniref:Altered inheritance of mitochondria protein 11 n=1 Tax=Sporothrix eucalyptigena TaxID=1812306 RepID=A0ABP0BIS8_9PEZI
MPIIANLFRKLLPPDSPESTASPAPPATTSQVPTSPSIAQSKPSAPVQSTSAVAAALPPREPYDTSIFSARSLKQLSLFFAGAAFFALSTTITRRSVNRKRLAAQLKFYSPSSTGTMTLGEAGANAEAAAAQATKEEASHGSFMAVEALNLATLNVVSFFLMMTGGVSWALDLSSLDDLRAMARRYTRGTGLNGPATDEEAEREVQEWVAKVLTKSDGTLIGGSKKKGDENENK